jgi:hypothetical protein
MCLALTHCRAILIVISSQQGFYSLLIHHLLVKSRRNHVHRNTHITIFLQIQPIEKVSHLSFVRIKNVNF